MDGFGRITSLPVRSLMEACRTGVRRDSHQPGWKSSRPTAWPSPISDRQDDSFEQQEVSGRDGSGFVSIKSSSQPLDSAPSVQCWSRGNLTNRATRLAHQSTIGEKPNLLTHPNREMRRVHLGRLHARLGAVSRLNTRQIGAVSRLNTR